MSSIPVFKDINNKWYTEADITEGLKSIELSNEEQIEAL